MTEERIAALEARLAEMERRYAEQDKVISELNTEAFRREGRIERLEAAFKRASEALRDMQAEKLGDAPHDVAPPHY